jgi:hypothetical protein
MLAALHESAGGLQIAIAKWSCLPEGAARLDDVNTTVAWPYHGQGLCSCWRDDVASCPLLHVNMAGLPIEPSKLCPGPRCCLQCCQMPAGRLSEARGL